MMTIRRMQMEDIPAVLKIQDKLQFQEWNQRQYQQELKASYTYATVYERDDVLLGYAVFHLLGEDSELLSIAVSPDVQGKGIGNSLLQDGFSQLDFKKGDRLFLEVKENNGKARHFYESHGFTLFGIRKKYYADGKNAALYRIEGK